MAFAPNRTANLPPKNFCGKFKCSYECLSLVVATERYFNLSRLIKNFPINLNTPRCRSFVVQFNKGSTAVPVIAPLWAVRPCLNGEYISGGECF